MTSLKFNLQLLVVVFQFLLFSSAAVTTQWVKFDGEVFSVSSVAPDNYIAVASFENSINSTGWAKLDVATTSGRGNVFTDSQQAYAAGFLEAYMTRPLVQMHWTNTIGNFCPPPLSSTCKGLKNFLQENFDWMLDNIKTYADSDPYWYQIDLFLNQVAGFQDGYAHANGKLNLDIDVFGIYLFQVGGDMEDLGSLFSPSSFAQDSDINFGLGVGRCSALIRLLADFSDLYVSQDTWGELNGMLRILKKYSFDFAQSKGSKDRIPGMTMTFSSYPGSLMSGDDFYSISSGLISQETTIGNSNAQLNKYIVPESVLEGARSMVANRLATSGRSWSEIFARYNSGTYNNQWMIIDYSKFQRGNRSPVPGLFYLLEQLPHYVLYEDLTSLLYEQSYFGSYNIPYFPLIFNESGAPALVKKYGEWFTYHGTPRALIFLRDIGGVTDLDSMTKLMRYNNFKHDPLSRCHCTPPYSAENAIACRDDLNAINGTYPFSALGHRPHVATDMKLTNLGMSRTLSFLAISSPPYDDLPAFQWSTSYYNTSLSHVGHPDIWQFPRILFNGANPMA